MRDSDETIITRFSSWYVRGEAMPRLALHVHGDRVAFAAANEIEAAFNALQDDRLLDMNELRDEVGRIARGLGLEGYAGDCRCRTDHLKTIVDVSLYKPGFRRGSTA